MTVAETVAAFLAARGVERVFALCGGHVMPIWMAVDAAGIAIIDVRDERAAVHMAQAHAELTGGLGAAMVTAGPGVTNALTGIANAHVSRAPVLVLSGTPPTAQENRGALQDLDHLALAAPVTRYARTLRDPAHTARELDEAAARALGEGGEPGPAFVQVPTDLLRAAVPEAGRRAEHLAARPRPRLQPDPDDAARAADLIWSARRPLAISGRGARGAGAELRALLDRSGCAYLDTGESRGLVPDDHPAAVAAMRGAALSGADLVVTVGRKLDFQLAYGSPAVFGAARFVRIADTAGELRDNRRGAVEILASPAPALAAIAAAAGNRTPAVDREWIESLRRGHAERAARLRRALAEAPPGRDGRMHPNRLIGALRDRLDGDSIVVVDGGDFLSFAPRRAVGAGRARPRPVRLHRRRRSLRRRRRAGAPRQEGPGGDGRRRVPASTRWRSTPPSATARGSFSSSPTTAPGRSRSTTRPNATARPSGRACNSPTTRRWRAGSGCTPSASNGPRTCRRRSTARSPARRRWSTRS